MTLMVASASMHVGPGRPSELPLSSLDLTEVVYRVPEGSLASVPSSHRPDWLPWLRRLTQFGSDGWRVAHATRGVPAASDARRPGWPPPHSHTAGPLPDRGYAALDTSLRSRL